MEGLQELQIDEKEQQNSVIIDHKYQQKRLTQFQLAAQKPKVSLVCITGLATIVNTNELTKSFCPYTDITVFYYMQLNPSNVREHYYTPLYEFLQLDFFPTPVISSLLEMLDKLGDPGKIVFQLILRFISPKRFADEVRKAITHAPLSLFHMKLSCMTALEKIIETTQFQQKFRSFCEFFKFSPVQSVIQFDQAKATILWSSMGIFQNLDKVIYAIMMPALLKFPEVLQATKQISAYQESNAKETNQLHQVLDFKIIGWGRCNQSSQASFYLESGIDNTPITHGETLVFVFRPLGDLPASQLLTKWILGTPHVLKNGDMNITVLNKEFFRRKLRCNVHETTGVLISKIQSDLHILLNHISFEDAHFQGYVMTAPFYNFSILAIESDNHTIGKIANLIHEKLSDICQPSEQTLKEEAAQFKQTPRSMHYSLYTFRNFIYKDSQKEEEMMNYILNQSKSALILQQDYQLLNKLINEWPHPGCNSEDLQETEIQTVDPNPPNIDHSDYDENDPYWSDPLLQEADDPSLEPFEENEIPISFTKDKLISDLSSVLVEYCFRLAKHHILNPHSIRLQHDHLNVLQKSL